MKGNEGDTWREMSLEYGVKIVVENISQGRGEEKGQDRNRPGKPAGSDVA